MELQTGLLHNIVPHPLQSQKFAVQPTTNPAPPNAEAVKVATKEAEAQQKTAWADLDQRGKAFGAEAKDLEQKAKETKGEGEPQLPRIWKSLTAVSDKYWDPNKATAAVKAALEEKRPDVAIAIAERAKREADKAAAETTSYKEGDRLYLAAQKVLREKIAKARKVAEKLEALVNPGGENAVQVVGTGGAVSYQPAQGGERSGVGQGQQGPQVAGPSQASVQAAPPVVGPSQNVQGNPPNVPGPEAAGQGEVGGKYADFLGSVIKRWTAEAKGQDILDGMEESGISPVDVARQFWSKTYFDMPAEVQNRFRAMLKQHSGGRSTDLSEADNLDLPNKADELEGGERGFVALMKEANDRFAQTGQQESAQPVKVFPPAKQEAAKAEPLDQLVEHDVYEVDDAGKMTGNVVRAKVPARQALADIDERHEFAKAMLECLGT